MECESRRGNAGLALKLCLSIYLPSLASKHNYHLPTRQKSIHSCDNIPNNRHSVLLRVAHLFDITLSLKLGLISSSCFIFLMVLISRGAICYIYQLVTILHPSELRLYLFSLSTSDVISFRVFTKLRFSKLEIAHTLFFIVVNI